MRPTLKDVADAAGVHTGTASRALNPQSRYMVSEKTARRVERAAEALGYQPNPVARSLRTTRSTTVGIVIPDLTNPIFPPMVRGVESILEGAGYTALVVNTDGDLHRERTQIESLRTRQVDGYIVATAMREDHDLLTELRDQQVPVVQVNRRVEELALPLVAGDDDDGTFMLVRHLVELGHSRIAHISGPTGTSSGLARHRAFHAALREYSLPDNPRLCVESCQWSELAGADAARHLVDNHEEFTAVVAGNDLIALGCYTVFAERGIRCPDDISVTGFNDMPFLDKMRPSLTTIRVPHFQIGVEAARMLFECLDEQRQEPRSLVLPVTLVARESTQPPATRDAD